MYILKNESNRSYLANLEQNGGINLQSGKIRFNNGGNFYILHNVSDEELESRFNDIVAALASKKVDIYDADKPVGYWKPKPSTHTKAEAKASPPAGK